MSWTSLLLVVLALAGFIISSYFTAVAYRWIRPDAAWIPSFCRLGEKTCATIVFTPRARVFGVPNSVLGQLFYPLITAGTVEGFLFTFPIFHLSLLASLVTVLLGLFLTYSLLFLTRVRCILCFTSHAINVVIFILLILEKDSASGALW